MDEYPGPQEMTPLLTRRVTRQVSTRRESTEKEEVYEDDGSTDGKRALSPRALWSIVVGPGTVGSRSTRCLVNQEGLQGCSDGLPYHVEGVGPKETDH